MESEWCGRPRLVGFGLCWLVRRPLWLIAIEAAKETLVGYAESVVLAAAETKFDGWLLTTEGVEIDFLGVVVLDF